MPETKPSGYLDRASRLTISSLLSGQLPVPGESLRGAQLSGWRRLSEGSVFIALFPAFLYALAVETITGYRHTHLDKLMDPDSYMRIVRIRDGLHSGWFTHVVAADNGGNGTVVYWSHLLDAIVLVLQLPLRLVLSDSYSLFVAGSVTGPIFAALIVAALVWAPSPLLASDRAWLWIAPFAAMRTYAIFTYGLLGYVHYHLLLVVFAVAAVGCAARAAFGNPGAGLWCGFWSAMAIWLSPEALPYVLMAIGAIGVAWCRQPSLADAALKRCGTAFCATVVAAALVDPPYGGWLSPEIDCISIVYAVLAILVCGAAWLLVMLGPRLASPWGRFVCCLTIGGAVIGFWLWLYPSISRGLGGLVPSSDARVFFGAISEMGPVTRDWRGLVLLTPGIFAVVSAFGLAWQQRSVLWLYAGGCGIVVLTLAAMYIRFIGYSEAAGILMLLATLGSVDPKRHSLAGRAIFRTVVTAVFLFTPLGLATLGHGPEPIDAMRKCDVAAIVPALQQEANAIVLTEISDAPEILWRAPVRTVGSLYHRSIGAFIRARNAWRTGPSDVVPQAVQASGVTDILACDLTARTALVSDLPPDTLQDRLARHDVPAWLHLVGRAGGYSLYRIAVGTSGAPGDGKSLKPDAPAAR